MKRFFHHAALLGAGAALALFALDSLPWTRPAVAAVKLNFDPDPVTREAGVTSFAPVLKQAAPSVVYIYTTKTVRIQQRSVPPMFDDPFFRRFFGDQFDPDARPRERQETGLGSGVIVSEDGYILTNNHVVEGADEIKVTMAGNRTEYTAKLVGADPPTDIAVLKVEATGLPTVTLTDSDKLEVGDIVLAIGNPLGVGQTVTMGIVSATGRGGFGIVDYEDFIQTDASINLGNSGGALVDAQGRLVGINTAILSGTGGNIGIGFAVPINMARSVMERIIDDGKVVRGFLGVNLEREISPELAEALKLTTRQGALISGVAPNTPAAEAGFKVGDLIVEFNGKQINDSRHLRLTVSQTPPKTKSAAKVLREGKERTIQVTLGELQPEELAEAPERRVPPRHGGEALEGVEVADLDAHFRRQFNIPAHVRGAVVMQVAPSSPAAAKGLRAGDIILDINGRPVNNADDAIKLSRQQTDRIVLRVWSGGGSRFIVVDPAKRGR
jgi:serine protease Do